MDLGKSDEEQAMATYAIEQFALYVQGYLVEADSEADAIARFFRGETWDDTVEFNRQRGPGFQKIHVKYRYAGPEPHGSRTLQKIVTGATLDWDGEGMPQGVTVKVVSQENPGFIYFDSEAGRLAEMETSEKRTVEYAANGRIAQEQVTVASKIETIPIP